MIGPVSSRCARSASARTRATGLLATDDEVKVFYNLCPGRVHFRGERGLLYFVDSPYESISDIIAAVFRGLGRQPKITQLYLDEHCYLKGAKVLHLEGMTRETNALLVALRLNGVHIDRAAASINASTPG